MRYEPGLDGLRAIAVLGVLAFHNEFSWARGGFLGISLFFTLSGYLITSILLDGARSSRSVDVRGFWTRRARRLLPAALLTLLGVVVFAGTIATRGQLADLDGAVVACVMQLSNWFFVFTHQSYVGLFSAPSPVQHFWSLSIEGQFYVVMPLVLVVLLRRGARLRTLGTVFAVGAVASSAWMALLFAGGASADRLYYGTDTRLAELLVGCALAVLLHARPNLVRPRRTHLLAVVTAAALIVTLWSWSHLTLGDDVLWRGGFFVGALLSATLIVGVLAGAGPVAAVLSNRYVAAIGLVSYGLYLFHWPLFLWLTPDRTGLAPWPLFGVRVGVTAGLATLSYHLLERPLRSREFRVRWVSLRALAGAATVVVIAGTALAVQRDAPNEFAGLGVATTRPDVSIDPLRVLVVVDGMEQDLAHEFAALKSRNGVEVRVAAPFTCAGVVPPDATCSNWTREWRKLVATFDPDAVLFHVNGWSGPPIASLCGCTNLEQQTVWTANLVDHGLDLLTARRAPVLWSQAHVDLGSALRRERDPFYLAMGRLTRTRADLVDLQAPGHGVDDLLADARTYRRRRAGDVTRVLVVGDSSAKSLGYGLERWAPDHAAVVWTTAAEGCGIARDGALQAATGAEAEVSERCRAVWDEWREQIRSFRPDVVVVLSELFDLAPRRLDGWRAFLAPGDRDFDDYLVSEYEQAYDILAAGGARVVWMKPPCARIIFGNQPAVDHDALALDRVEHFGEVVLGRLAASRPRVRTFDLFGALCPDGDFTDELDGIEHIRPDGIHFGPEGSRWFAERYGPELLARS